MKHPDVSNIDSAFWLLSGAPEPVQFLAEALSVVEGGVEGFALFFWP